MFFDNKENMTHRQWFVVGMAGGPPQNLAKGPLFAERGLFCYNIFESFRVSEQYGHLEYTMAGEKF